MPARPFRKPLLAPAVRVVAVPGLPEKRQPLASRTTAPSTMAEIAQRIGSGSAQRQHEVAERNPHRGGHQQQADATPVDQAHDSRDQWQGHGDFQQQAERDADRRARSSAENIGVIIMAAPKPAKPAPCLQCRQRRRKSGREGQQVGHQRARDASIAGPASEHHIMQAMPSKNLAVSTVPLLMPYIQRRPETRRRNAKPFKLVSDYTAGRRPARGDPPAHRGRAGRRARPGAAGRHRLGQDLHHGQRHCHDQGRPALVLAPNKTLAAQL